MATEIIWSDNAILDFNTILDYILVSWNADIAADFRDNLDYKVRRLAIHPDVGMRSTAIPEIRSILITGHNRLYYRMLSEQLLEIVAIFDTRQNPSKNKFESER